MYLLSTVDAAEIFLVIFLMGCFHTNFVPAKEFHNKRAVTVEID